MPKNVKILEDTENSDESLKIQQKHAKWNTENFCKWKKNLKCVKILKILKYDQNI